MSDHKYKWIKTFGDVEYLHFESFQKPKIRKPVVYFTFFTTPEVYDFLDKAMYSETNEEQWFSVLKHDWDFDQRAKILTIMRKKENK